MCGKQQYVSDELTHFVGRKKDPEEQFCLLCKILREGRLLPHGKEDHAAGNLRLPFDEQGRLRPFWTEGQVNELFFTQMVSFCDIPLECLSAHVGKYSSFGIAFAKDFLARKGASPVFYVAEQAPCTDHGRQGAGRVRPRGEFFDEVVRCWVSENITRLRGLSPTTRAERLFLWYFLAYTKFFDHRLKETDAADYYMEREWRTIGEVTFGLANVCRVIVPNTEYRERLRNSFPGFPGTITPLSEL